MRSIPNMKPFRCQSGVALLIFMVVLVLVFSTYAVKKLNSTNAKTEMDITTTKSLAVAKQAVIAYAMTNQDRSSGVGNPNDGLLGFLPCPDTGVFEGRENVPCGAQYQNALGMMPWATLDVAPIKDGAGYCLWYAVASEYKDNGQDDRNHLDNASGLSRSEMLNEDSNGSFLLNDASGNLILGNNPESRLVAVIIAPGQSLLGQNRNPIPGTQCGMDYSASDYLEGGNEAVTNVNDSLDTFTTSRSSRLATLNDRVIGITQQDIFDAVKRRSDFVTMAANATRELAQCIADFGSANDVILGSGNNHFHLPWPASISQADYRDSQQYIEDDTAGSYLGRFPGDVTISDSRVGNTGTAYLLEKTACASLNTNAQGSLPNQYNSQARRFWQNWKDHFFYAVSGDFASTSPLSPTPITPAPCTNCITVNGTEYAAIVIYSGERQGGQTRSVTPNDPDTKQAITNYLEGNNATNFPDVAGNDEYMLNTINDIAFCVAKDMSVSQCP